MENLNVLCGSCGNLVPLDDCDEVQSINYGYYLKCAGCGARFKLKAEPLFDDAAEKKALYHLKEAQEALCDAGREADADTLHEIERKIEG
jgi:hypothetical protein